MEGHTQKHVRPGGMVRTVLFAAHSSFSAATVFPIHFTEAVPFPHPHHNQRQFPPLSVHETRRTGTRQPGVLVLILYILFRKQLQDFGLMSKSNNWAWGGGSSPLPIIQPVNMMFLCYTSVLVQLYVAYSCTSTDV